MGVDHEIEGTLLARGRHHLASVGDWLDRADPAGSVSPAARLLCCGLAGLAEAAADARAVSRRDEVGEAAALLALLTKIDDEVIDAVAFHGGAVTDRGVVRRRTRAWLAPTLTSIRQGVPATPEPRCALAAEVGRQLRALAVDESRLLDLLGLISEGWAVQVDAVEVFSAPVGSVPLPRVREVTGRISGLWLAMITLVGLLPAAVAPHPHEVQALLDWGLPIQSADALADLHKDLRDRVAGTLPVARAAQRRPGEVEQALARGDAYALDRLIVQTGSHTAMLPGVHELTALDEALDGLGVVPRQLRWIHGFLLGRYLAREVVGSPASFRPFLTSAAAWRDTHGGLACSA